MGEDRGDGRRVPPDGGTTSATDDSAAGLGSRDEVVDDGAVDADEARDAEAADGDTPDTDVGVEEGSGEPTGEQPEVRGPAGGPGDPVGRGGREPSLQRHHDAETEADTSSGGPAQPGGSRGASE